ncbi:Uncharacterised protein [BD1-7 clade bacterium]|uniref:Uncharacterized protein n=1 Tax=BD1-7 clade bacterium TaxID=2029982 RepID=A0A5S9NQI1_9GAMM|nr:Uncharacterised protein [BD1-7 clade bacterium]
MNKEKLLAVIALGLSIVEVCYLLLVRADLNDTLRLLIGFYIYGLLFYLIIFMIATLRESHRMGILESYEASCGRHLIIFIPLLWLIGLLSMIYTHGQFVHTEEGVSLRVRDGFEYGRRAYALISLTEVEYRAELFKRDILSAGKHMVTSIFITKMFLFNLPTFIRKSESIKHPVSKKCTSFESNA